MITQYIVEKIMGQREGTRELEPDEDDIKTEAVPADPASKVTDVPITEVVKTEDKTTVKIEPVPAAASEDVKLVVKEADKPPVPTIKVTEYYVKYKNL